MTTTAARDPDELTVEHVVTRPPVSRAQRLGAGISLSSLGLLTVWRFGRRRAPRPGRRRIRLGALNAAHVPDFTVPAVPVAWVAGV